MERETIFRDEINHIFRLVEREDPPPGESRVIREVWGTFDGRDELTMRVTLRHIGPAHWELEAHIPTHRASPRRRFATSRQARALLEEMESQLLTLLTVSSVTGINFVALALGKKGRS